MPSQVSRHDKALQREADLAAYETVFTCQEMYDFDGVFDTCGTVRSPYPDLLIWLVTVCSAVTGRVRRTEEDLHSPGVWPRLLEHYQRATGVRLSLPRPPSPRHVDGWGRRLSESPEQMGRLFDHLRRTGIGVAWTLGHLIPDGAPDHAHPDRRNLVTGDGTWMPPYSEVVRVVGSDGEVCYLGSRARKPERALVQHSRTTADPTKPNAMGVLNVIFMAPTTAGAIWLSADQVLEGSEAHAALRYLRELLTLVPRGLDTLAYDKAITGHLLETVMSFGINPLIRPVGRADNYKGGDARYSARLTHSSDAFRRFRACHPDPGRPDAYVVPRRADNRLDFDALIPLGVGVYRSSKADTIEPDVDAVLEQNQLDREAADRVGSDAPEQIIRANVRLDRRSTARRSDPAGGEPGRPSRIARRPDAEKDEGTIQGGLLLMRTKYYPIPADQLADHVHPAGCAHRWWLDGDALVATEMGPDRHWYVIATAEAVHSYTQTNRNGTAEWHTSWTLTCHHGTHTFRTATRPGRDLGEQDGWESAWACLRPLSRAHGSAWTLANQRNVTESQNSWWKQRSSNGIGPRARHLSVDHQRLDLYAAWGFNIADVCRVRDLQAKLA